MITLKNDDVLNAFAKAKYNENTSEWRRYIFRTHRAFVVITIIILANSDERNVADKARWCRRCSVLIRLLCLPLFVPFLAGRYLLSRSHKPLQAVSWCSR